MLILAIESSCDETSVAILKDGKTFLSNIISTQIEIHKEYGGVVPELASRHHIKNIGLVLDEALEEAGVTLNKIDYIAVTYGPGLIGALLVGVSFAKALSYANGIPLIPVHHIKGHIYSNFLERELNPALISLVVSGGHTNVIHLDENYKFQVIGETLDDAVGEAYDKVARVLGLGYPGGPIIDKLAKEGDKDKIKLPEPKVGGYNFSFSGIKTAVINYINKEKMKGNSISERDLAAAFQSKVVEILVKKVLKAAKEYQVDKILIAGGVAANSHLREELAKKGQEEGLEVILPKLSLCTDNAGMIALAAYYKITHEKNNQITVADGLALNAKATLNIEQD